MQNARLDEAQAGIKIPGRNIITSDMQMIPPLITESKEELMSILMKVKGESENPGLKLNIQKTKIMASVLIQFSSVQFSRSVVSDSSQPHELQHARPPCPSPTPGVHSDSRPSSQ